MTDAVSAGGGPQVVLDGESAREILARSMDRPQVGRVYDYYLGGNANWAIDREFAKKVILELPNIAWVAQQNRQFLGHAVQYMLAQGVRQFIDLGSGLPTRGNVHEVAELRVPGECRVVYVDNDPVAAAHGYLLLEKFGDLERHIPIAADAMDHQRLMAAIEDHTPLDLGQPVGVLCVALLHFITEDQKPYEALRQYRDHFARGSNLALSHLTMDGLPPEGQQRLAAAMRLYDKASSPALVRNSDEICRLLGVEDGWELVDPPGLCWTSEWRTDDVHESNLVGELATYESLIAAGVSRKL